MIKGLLSQSHCIAGHFPQQTGAFELARLCKARVVFNGHTQNKIACFVPCWRLRLMFNADIVQRGG